MLRLILRIRKRHPWWRVVSDDKGEVKQYSFVLPMLLDWLKSVLRGRR